MILRFTDGERHVSFNTTWRTWNDLDHDPEVDPAIFGDVQFIEIPPAALIEIIKNLDFNAFGYSTDLHHELVIPDEAPDDEVEIPLF